MRLRLLVLLFYITAPFLSMGQNIRHLSENEGLPQSFISGIAQDGQGYVWIATRNGLARYDGHNFKIYQHSLSDAGSIASNAITHLKTDAANSLWIKFETGEIDVMDMHTGIVRHIITRSILNKKKLAIIRRGWCLGNNNTFWYIAPGGKVKSFTYLPNGTVTESATFTFAGDTIRSLLNDSQKRLWVLSQKGLNLYNASSKKFTLYHIYHYQRFNDELDFGDDIPDLHERPNGELMWTDLHRVFFFNPKTRNYRTIRLKEQPEYSVKWINTGPDGKEYFICGSNIYSYTDAEGLTCVAGKGIQDFRTIQAFLVDNSGLIWTGGNTDGITQIDLSTNFESNSYKDSFVIDVLRKYLHFPETYLPLATSIYKGALPLSYYLRSVKKGAMLFIALNRQVFQYDMITGKTERFPTLPTANDNKFRPIKGITSGTDGKLMVIDRYGAIYSYTKGAWTELKLKTSAKTPYLQYVESNDIYSDDKNLWITTEYDGLFYVDKSTLVLSKVPQPKKGKGLTINCLYSMVPDPARAGILWIGSPEGLICFDTNTFKTTIYAVNQGLPDNVIYAILPDAAGHLWLGTNKGLARFDPVSHTCRAFNLSHGLPNNEFNRFHQLQLPGNKLAFGGIKGYTVFDPAKLIDDNFNPRLGITNIFINNLEFNELTDITQAGSFKKLELPYNENTLSIEYAALQFSHPQQIQYRYRLKGYDDTWVMAGNRRDAVYTKLPPGHYVFEVNATNTTGKWSTYITSLPVVISPPWWAAWWAWVLYIAVGITAVVLFIHFKIKQRVMKNEIALKQKEAQHLRELDDMKTHFFANITHELRTPLALIMGPAEELQKNTLAPEPKKLAEIITKNAGSLLNLTNQLLDMAKLEAGALKPHVSAGDIVEAIRRIAGAFNEEASSKAVIIEIIAKDTAGYIFDAYMFERIVSNLLSNALRFSPQGGKISITLTPEEKGIALSVADEGSGIDKADLEHIFERFYRAHTAQNNTVAGSGIGLSLVKELVELQGGSISVTSCTEKPAGSVFTIFLPLESFERLSTSKTQVIGDFSHQKALQEGDEKPLILIVEDNVELLFFIDSILSPHYTTVHAQNGSEALPKAQSLLPDIIISDVLMKEMDGYALCHAIKNNTATSHIPVVLLTAKADAGSKLEGFSYGADDYITKPFSVEELLMRVNNRVVQQQRLKQALYKQLTSLPETVERQEQEPAVHAYMLTIYDVIDKNIDNDAFGVEELADALNISRTGLHRKIKALTDMTTSEMLRSYRLSKAIHLLKEGLTIAEAAYKTGFASPSYFTRSFKDRYGITPTEYLKNGLKQQ